MGERGKGKGEREATAAAFVAVLMSKFPVAIFLLHAAFSWPPFVAPKCCIVFVAVVVAAAAVVSASLTASSAIYDTFVVSISQCKESPNIIKNCDSHKLPYSPRGGNGSRG